MRFKEKNRGFTLVEVIVVLVILAILAAVLVPVLSGFIDKAKENTAITQCQACVKASQALVSESYAENPTNPTVDYAKAMTLAEVDGIGTIETVDIAEGGVTHLLYQNDAYIVKYCKEGGCDTCGNSKTYTVLKNSGKTRQQTADATFASLITAIGNVSGGYGNVIDGVNKDNPSTVAYKVYNLLSAEEKEFLDSVSWSYTQSGGSWRLYITEKHYTAGESADNVKVYKYNPQTKQYQYATKNTKVTDGKIAAAGNNWSDWSDTMD